MTSTSLPLVHVIGTGGSISCIGTSRTDFLDYPYGDRHYTIQEMLARVPEAAARMLAPPLSSRFIHRQTTANQVRFTTVELSDLEVRILNAANHALEIETHSAGP